MLYPPKSLKERNILKYSDEICGCTFPLLPARLYDGWVGGGLATHNSLAGPPTSIRSPETYPSTPPSEGCIIEEMAKIIGSL